MLGSWWGTGRLDEADCCGEGRALVGGGPQAFSPPTRLCWGALAPPASVGEYVVPGRKPRPNMLDTGLQLRGQEKLVRSLGPDCEGEGLTTGATTE